MKINSWKTSLVLLVIIPMGLFAQNEKSLWFDVKVGLNSSWILNQNAYTNREMGYGSTFTPSMGIGASYFMNEDWGVNVSPGYIRLGQNYNEDLSLGSATRQLKLSYIQVPLLLMYKIPMTSNPTWLAFGPDLMFLSSASQEFTKTGDYLLNNPADMAPGDIKERFKPFDLALNFSVNKMYPLRSTDKMMFLVSFNTALGLTDINSKDWQKPNVHNEYKGSHNFYMGINVGLMFNTSKD